MKFLKRYLFSTLICILGLLAQTGCNGRKKLPPANPDNRQSFPDSTAINREVRKYESLHSDFADPKASRQLRKILQESIAAGYNDQACSLLMEIARFHAAQGNFDSTLHYFNKARPYCNKPIFDKTLPAAFLADLGAFYHGLRSDEVAANKSYYQALRYLKARNLTANTLTIKLNLYMFATQEKLGHPERGLTYLKDAEALALKLNFIPALIAVRTNLGNYYSERQDFRTARKYFDLAVENAEQNQLPDLDPNILMAAMVGKASVHTKTGEAEKAVPLLKKAMQIARENKIVYSEVVAAIELGGTYNKLGRFRETIPLVSDALRVQGQDFNWYKEEGYKALLEAYEGLGQYKPALEYQRKLYAFNDSLTGKEKTVALNELEIKYQTALKDKEISARQLLIEQQKNKLSRKNTLIKGTTINIEFDCLQLKQEVPRET